MSVSLNPSTSLGFNRPLTQHVKRTLTITNHNERPVAFKVKTTAPKLYCVRPNSGRVEPGGNVEVQVMLQAMKEEPPLSAKCKDKFLIQSTVISLERETQPLQEIWNATDGGDEVHSQKIRVVYLPPEGQTVPEEEEGHAEAAPAVHESGRFDTARRQQPADGAAGHDDEFHVDASSQLAHDVSYDGRQTEHPPSELVEPAVPVGVINVNVHTPPPPLPPTPPPTSDVNAELAAKLSAAQAEIERLRHLISTMPEPSVAASTFTGTTATELRRRRPMSDDGTSTFDDGETEVGTYISTEDSLAPAEGVPLQFVVAIALGVFVTTYLFF